MVRCARRPVLPAISQLSLLKRDPENSPECSEILYLCGNHCCRRSTRWTWSGQSLRSSGCKTSTRCRWHPPHRLPHTLLSSAKFQLVRLSTERFQLSCTLSPGVAGILDAAPLEVVHVHTETTTKCQPETTTTFPDVLNLTRSFSQMHIDEQQHRRMHCFDVLDSAPRSHQRG